MPDSQPPPLAKPSAGRRRRFWLVVVLTIVCVEAAGVAYVYWSERTSLRKDQFAAYMRQGPWSDRFEYVAAGIKQPPTLAAGQANLRDDEEVIGLVAGGKARAYRLSAMLGREQHVVNDLLGDRPITVTYCDTAECVRAFADAPGRAPIAMDQGGLKGQRMVVRVDGVFYLQETGEPLEPGDGQSALPFKQYPTTRTTWGAWRRAHPETDVFAGMPE